MTEKRYLTKCCANCKYKEVILIFGDINDGFQCHLTEKRINLFEDCCDDFEICKQAKLHLGDNGVILSKEEIKELS